MKIIEIRNFIYTIESTLEPIEKIIKQVLNFLYKYHDDNYNSPNFNPLIKSINFDYSYDPLTQSLLMKYRINRRKWICISFKNFTSEF